MVSLYMLKPTLNKSRRISNKKDCKETEVGEHKTSFQNHCFTTFLVFLYFKIQNLLAVFCDLSVLLSFNS